MYLKINTFSLLLLYIFMQFCFMEILYIYNLKIKYPENAEKINSVSVSNVKITENITVNWATSINIILFIF